MLSLGLHVLQKKVQEIDLIIGLISIQYDDFSEKHSLLPISFAKLAFSSGVVTVSQDSVTDLGGAVSWMTNLSFLCWVSFHSFVKMYAFLPNQLSP